MRDYNSLCFHWLQFPMPQLKDKHIRDFSFDLRGFIRSVKLFWSQREN